MVGTAGTAFYVTRRPIMLDSANNPPTKTLAFPKTMLFSQTLTVASSEQINHDTKRITFKLPGGSGEVSGVPAGCMSSQTYLVQVCMLTSPSCRPHTTHTLGGLVSSPTTLHTRLRCQHTRRATIHRETVSQWQSIDAYALSRSWSNAPDPRTDSRLQLYAIRQEPRSPFCRRRGGHHTSLQSRKRDPQRRKRPDTHSATLGSEWHTRHCAEERAGTT